MSHKGKMADFVSQFIISTAQLITQNERPPLGGGFWRTLRRQADLHLIDGAFEVRSYDVLLCKWRNCVKSLMISSKKFCSPAGSRNHF